MFMITPHNAEKSLPLNMKEYWATLSLAQGSSKDHFKTELTLFEKLFSTSSDFCLPTKYLERGSSRQCNVNKTKN